MPKRTYIPQYDKVGGWVLVFVIEVQKPELWASLHVDEIQKVLPIKYEDGSQWTRASTRGTAIVYEFQLVEKRDELEKRGWDRDSLDQEFMQFAVENLRIYA